MNSQLYDYSPFTAASRQSRDARHSAAARVLVQPRSLSVAGSALSCRKFSRYLRATCEPRESLVRSPGIITMFLVHFGEKGRSWFVRCSFFFFFFSKLYSVKSCAYYTNLFLFSGAIFFVFPLRQSDDLFRSPNPSLEGHE